MDLGLKGLNALVTGGSRGMGRAIAQTLAAEGANIAFCARGVGGIGQTVEDFAKYGVKVHGSKVDVAEGARMRGWVEDVAAAFGGIDIVVANVSAQAMADDEAAWQRGFEVDLMGTVRLVDAAMPMLERSAHAAIVTIGSVSHREVDLAGPHGALKAAIVHYTQGLAFRLAAKRIRANSVSPGTTYAARDPTGRMGTPQEVANAAVFLASPAASFITGTHLVVDGALTRGV